MVVSPAACIIAQELMDYMKQKFTATVWREGDWFVAQCLEVDVASQGETKAEALGNLHEALELHFEPPMATVLPEISPLEIELAA